MIYGAILDKGQKWYTDLSAVFHAMNHMHKNYHWLITDWECSQPVRELKDRSVWMTGGSLDNLLRKHKDLQWIWGVFSGFDKSVAKEEVFRHPLPYAHDYNGFWKNPVSIQHPLASVEIIPWDSSCVLFISREQKAAADFRKAFPLSEDLSEYNSRYL